MNIKITARKFKARESLKEFVTDEVKTLEKFADDILDAEVILSYQNPKDSIKKAEIRLNVPGTVVTAADESDEYEKAVRSAVEKLERQLKKLKTRRHDHL